MDNPIWSYIFKAPKEKRAAIELLQSLPAFEGLGVKDLVQIERIIHQRSYRAGEVVFDEDMPGAGMYIITDGEVVVKKRIDVHRTIDLAVIKERHFFGEVALIDEIPRSASVVAVKDTVLLAFCKPDLENIIERNPKVALKIINNIARLICKRLVKANENLEIMQRKLDRNTSSLQERTTQDSDEKPDA